MFSEASLGPVFSSDEFSSTGANPQALKKIVL